MQTTDPEPPTEELIWFSWVPHHPAASGGPVEDLVELVEAIRRHQSQTSHPAVPKRPADHALYRRMGEIEGAAPSDEPRPVNGNRFQIRGH